MDALEFKHRIERFVLENTKSNILKFTDEEIAKAFVILKVFTDFQEEGLKKQIKKNRIKG